MTPLFPIINTLHVNQNYYTTKTESQPLNVYTNLQNNFVYIGNIQRIFNLICDEPQILHQTYVLQINSNKKNTLS